MGLDITENGKDFIDMKYAKNIVNNDPYEVSSIINTSGTEEDAPKIAACRGLKKGDFCTWEFKGIKYTGHCRYNKLTIHTTLYCSDLPVGTKKDSLDA